MTAAEMKPVSTGSTCGTRDITAALNTIYAHLLRSVGRCGNQSRIVDPDGCKVDTSASTVLNTESAHRLRAMPGAILHERPAKVSTGQAPRLGEITYTITKVGLRLR